MDLNKCTPVWGRVLASARLYVCPRLVCVCACVCVCVYLCECSSSRVPGFTLTTGCSRGLWSRPYTLGWTQTQATVQDLILLHGKFTTCFLPTGNTALSIPLRRNPSRVSSNYVKHDKILQSDSLKLLDLPETNCPNWVYFAWKILYKLFSWNLCSLPVPAGYLNAAKWTNNSSNRTENPKRSEMMHSCLQKCTEMANQNQNRNETMAQMC